MAPTIHCVRHGQGFHNVGLGDYTLHDPRLTSLGETQCRALRDQVFPDQSRLSLIAASPLIRALQSASVTFGPALARQNILAIPDAQETSHDSCDVGSDVDVLKKVCVENEWPVDLSLVGEGWNVKVLGSRYSPSSRAIAHRARDVRLFLRQKARDLVLAGDVNAEIVLVAHGGFMHYFTGDWEDADKRPGTGWTNCETRSYTFGHGVDSDDGDALLVESSQSRQRRGLDHLMLPREAQVVLYQKAMAAWESQGLQNHGKLDLEEDKEGSNVNIVQKSRLKSSLALLIPTL